MKNAKKDIRTLIFSGFILLLLIPFIQREFSIVNDGKLEGAFISKEKPVFNNKDWFSGKFQTASEEYLNESFGFRNVMVRLNNQIAFTFFRKANADNIVEKDPFIPNLFLNN